MKECFDRGDADDRERLAVKPTGGSIPRSDRTRARSAARPSVPAPPSSPQKLACQTAFPRRAPMALPVPHTTATPWPSDVPARSAPSPSLTITHLRDVRQPPPHLGVQEVEVLRPVSACETTPGRHDVIAASAGLRERAVDRGVDLGRGPPRPSSRRYRRSRLARSRARRHRGPQRSRPSWCCRHRGRERSFARDVSRRSERRGRDAPAQAASRSVRFGRHRSRWYRPSCRSTRELAGSMPRPEVGSVGAAADLRLSQTSPRTVLAATASST